MSNSLDLGGGGLHKKRRDGLTPRDWQTIKAGFGNAPTLNIDKEFSFHFEELLHFCHKCLCSEGGDCSTLVFYKSVSK